MDIFKKISNNKSKTSQSEQAGSDIDKIASEIYARNSNSKIVAIRELMQETELGLGESKEIIDKYFDNQ